MGLLAKLFNVVPEDERKGASLDFRLPQWKVEPTKDFVAYLQALSDLVPQGAVLYLEGNPPIGPLKNFLEATTVPEQLHVAGGTIWPRPQVFHIPATERNLSGLSEIASVCGTPEVYHLHVYCEGKVLLQWYDAFADPLYILKEIPEDKVKAFCQKLSLQYETDTEGVEQSPGGDSLKAAPQE
jgi:hypothetical protein